MTLWPLRRTITQSLHTFWYSTNMRNQEEEFFGRGFLPRVFWKGVFAKCAPLLGVVLWVPMHCWAQYPLVFLVSWAWDSTLQKPPWLKPPFLGSWKQEGIVALAWQYGVSPHPARRYSTSHPRKRGRRGKKWGNERCPIMHAYTWMSGALRCKRHMLEQWILLIKRKKSGLRDRLTRTPSIALSFSATSAYTLCQDYIKIWPSWCKSTNL